MPYVKQEVRDQLDDSIEQLADKIVAASPNDTDFAGNLNYACTTLTMRIIKKKFGQIRYWMIALVTGTFKNVADEFYRRVAAPYEDKKITEEGDVKEYK